MGRRHDDRTIRRRGPYRDPKHRILIVCEGRLTEPGYFKALQHEVRNPRLHVKAIGPAGVPVTVVETALAERSNADDEAERERDDNLRWDQVWAVFDRDDHPNLGDAMQLAERNGSLLRSRTHASSSGRCSTSRSRGATSRAPRFAKH